MVLTILGSVGVGLLVAVIVGLIIWKMVRDGKAGKSVICGGDCSSCGAGCHAVQQQGCSGGCSGCPSASACHGDKTKS